MSELPERHPADLESSTVAKPVTPAWLADDPCPLWCEGDHPAEQHPEDRSHVAAVHVPVVHTPRSSTDAAAAEYVVAMRRYVGQTDTWVCIGEGENASRAVQVTMESARRLVTMTAALFG